MLSVSYQIVDSTSGAPITAVSTGMAGYSVRVAFGCSLAECTNTTVFIAPPPVDPTYGTFRKESAATYTPPFAGTTMTGNIATGFTVNLGTLGEGSNGSFAINYTIQNNNWLGYAVNNQVPGGSFFPNGSPITPNVSITSPNAQVTPPVAVPSTATWSSTVPSPTVTVSGVASIRTGSELTVNVGGSSNCWYWGSGGLALGNAFMECAKSLHTVVALPTGATYVAGSGGVYDAGTHTVTFDHSGTTATRGLHPFGLSFRVTFSGAGMPSTGTGCVTMAGFTADHSATYISDATNTAAQASYSVTVQNCTPFARGTLTKTSQRDAGTVANPIVYIPPTGGAAISRYWEVTLNNTSNIAGVGTIVDNTLGGASNPIPTKQITVATGGPATINYTLSDGSTGSVVVNNGASFTPTGGRTISAITAVSEVLAGPNATSATNLATPFRLRFFYDVVDGTAPQTWTNTASGSIAYDASSGLGTYSVGSVPRTVDLQPRPSQLRFALQNMSLSTIGGGTPIIGSVVQWNIRGNYQFMTSTDAPTPQYVWLAPLGWDIVPGSASLPVAGATYEYKTVSYLGNTYNAVVATYPTPLTGIDTVYAGALTVRATPTSSAVAGTASAIGFFGDAGNTIPVSYTPAAGYTDVTDFDADGSVNDRFATAPYDTTLSATNSLQVVKEICQPNASAADGCTWVANSSITVGVPPTATSVKYRVTIRNAGNGALTNVVAYDVLPHPGDTGLTDATIAIPRNSSVVEQVSSVSDLTGGVVLAYTTSVNPPRPQVYTGTTDATAWAASPAAGASAIRATVASLAVGASASFVYTAALVGAGADELACNSVAVAANGTAAVEPAAVCATTQEADFSVEAPDRLPLQGGRTGVVPFTVTNNGGSLTAAGTATLDIPVGVSIVDLTVPGWNCEAPTNTGPITVTCEPVNGDGSSRSLAIDTPETLDIAVEPDADVTGELCFTAEVEGVMFDPDLANNSDDVCLTVAPATPEIFLTKDDGVDAVQRGDEITYTLTVSNGLVSEPIAGLVLNDTLPAGVEFVAASDGGTITGNIVTWDPIDLAAGGVASGDGGEITGGAGSSVTRTVTVRVLDDADDEIVNTAGAVAPDPASPTENLTAEGTDTDDLLSYTVAKSVLAPEEGVYPGDVITYTVVLTNDGTGKYPDARLHDDLTGVLDDAQFVAGSGSVTVTGSAAASVADPAAGVLTWTGDIPAGGIATITYQVEVGEFADGELTNAAYASPASTDCDAGTGLDADGASCDTTTTYYGPTFEKSVADYYQNDNGTWSVSYYLTIESRNPAAATEYSLFDAFGFGPGIGIDYEEILDSPAGVTVEPWAGGGDIALDATLGALAFHQYRVAAIADPGTLTGAAPALCVDGTASAFTNAASLTLASGRILDSTACAEPQKPTVEKTADATTQIADGTWTTVYEITIAAPDDASDNGLAYTLEDEFDFPTGATVTGVTVTGPAGATLNSGFDGDTDTAILDAVDRVFALTPRVFTVTVTTSMPAESVSNLTCATGGYANEVTLYSGTSDDILDTSDACTDIVIEPTPDVTKSVASLSVDGSGNWVIEYEIEVTNPNATYSTHYSLDDTLQFAPDVTIVDATAGSADVAASGTWDGASDTALVTDQQLAAGATHTFTVIATVDLAGADTAAATADCLLDAGEIGSGLRNLAEITSGDTNDSATACEPLNDPSVVKTVAAEPTQDPATGLWTVEYEITVTNRSTSTVSGGIPYSVTDTFDFPSGVTIEDVVVSGPGTVNADFDGVSDTDLATGSISAATDASTPATRVYTVTVEFSLDGVAFDEEACGDGGLRNVVGLAVGTRESGADACADVPSAPVMSVTKSVLSQEQQSDGSWVVLYRIAVMNPSVDVAGFYDLADEFQLGADIQLTDVSVVSRPASVTVDPAFDADSSTTIAEEILLGGGATHQYTVRAEIDSAGVRGTDEEGDCVLGAGETGTGFRNVATATSGGGSDESIACATAFDPAVTKTVDGSPVLNADGSWTVAYVITVTNPSATVDLAYELTDELGFPAGTTYDVVDVATRAGGPTTSSTWNGVSDTVVVASGTELAGGAVHVFDVTVTATLPDGQGSLVDGFANSATVASSTDGAVTSDGDAAADIALPDLAISKESDAASVVEIGDTVTYTITVENTGDAAYTLAFPAEVVDDLTGVVDDATSAGAVTMTPAIGAVTTTATGFTWRGALAAGAIVELTYSVVVTGAGDQVLANTAFAPAIPNGTPTTPADCDDERCGAVSSDIPGFLLEKEASTGVITGGGQVEYTLTYTNTGLVDVTGATFSDDLSDVLDDAAFVGDPIASSGSVDVEGDTLTWTGTLSAGASVTVTYAVEVANPLTGNGSLINAATADPRFPPRWPGGVCPDDAAECDAPDSSTDVLTSVRSLAFTKASDATRISVGQMVVYTLTVTNIGAGDYTEAEPATIVDSMAGVLDDAVYNGDATAPAGDIVFMGTTLEWTGPLAAGETITVTYSVTTNSRISGDGILANIVGLEATALSPDALEECLTEPTDNAQAYCFVALSIAPLAHTGGTIWIVPILVALLLILAGLVVVVMRIRSSRVAHGLSNP